LFEEEFKHGSNGFDSKEAKEIIQKLRAKDNVKKENRRKHD
jgi:uncharacterized protein (UPF0335 family)